MKNKYKANLLRKFASDEFSPFGATTGAVVGGGMGTASHAGYEFGKLLNLVRKADRGDIKAMMKIPFMYPNVTSVGLESVLGGDGVKNNPALLKKYYKGVGKDIFRLLKKNPKLLAATIGLPALLGGIIGA